MPKIRLTKYQGRVSVSLFKILSEILERSDQQFTGYEIHKATDIQSGTVYPVIGRLVKDGWLTAEWEETDDTSDKPPRRLYTLTAGGYNEAIQLLSDYVTPRIKNCFENPATAI